VLGVCVLAENIDARKKAELALKQREEKLQKFNHELTLLNKINDTILVTQNEDALYERIVKCIVEKGRYKLAWVCNMPDSENKNQWVKPNYAFGETGYIDGININLTDPELSKGPTAKTLLTGKISVTNNVHQADYFKPWLERANKFGIAASIVIPIYSNDSKVAGALNIYSESADAFDENEMAVMERLGNNVSLAISAIRNRNEKDQASYFLNERIKELDTIYRVNNTLQNQSRNIDDMFTEIVNLLPAGWQFPEECESLIEFDNKTYHTPNYKPSPFSQKAKIETQDGKNGFIEVVYIREKPMAQEGPFLKEERDLINTLAESVQTHYNKKLNRKELMQVQANLKTMMDNTDVGHLLLDRDYTIISYNQRFSSSYAVVSGIKVRKKGNFIQLLLDDRRHAVKASFEKVRETKTAFEYETTYTLHNDNFYFNIVIMPVTDRGRVIGFCMSAYDVTKRKLMELERQKMIDDLVQRNTDLEQFSYIISHNLRAPIANIKGLLNLLATPVDETTTRNMLHGIDMAAQRVDEVIHDLNHILQTRREVTEPYSNVHLQTLVKKVVSGIPHLINESGTIITTNFEEAENIKAIPGYMTSIFHNLITNGIRYAQPGRAPRIHISSHLNNGALQLRFKDNGTGIDLTKYRNQLFGLYKRFHHDLEGKGIGLFMTKTQVEVMNGHINVTSTPGEGAEFILTFPQ
ncbi:MAG: GAF domain-containing protein, partial [Bacteroidia bacterium]|nr:GAF domain-containing protein [Bacteroidia bacterium]